MLIDDLFDRLVHRLRRSKRQGLNGFSKDVEQIHPSSPRRNGDPHDRSFLSGASNFVMNQPTFIENRRPHIVQMFAAGNSVLDPVLELISPHTDPDAAVDSSARFPPPLCHPGTRLTIGGKLNSWLNDPKRQWNIIWLHGPAGTGKSAVAQTFAEHCVENKRLGASFFFSRPNKRNNPDTLIPSLIYQLAVRNHDYKSLMTAQLASDPQLIRKARHIQFKKLIVEPFAQLQTQEEKHIQEPLLVVLDGLDECKGESAQREIVEMISEAMRLDKGLPLLWLVCSRPEAHLKYVFSRADYPVNCGREELVIDAESIADVDLYVLDGLAGIRAHFEDVTTPTWPSREQAAKLLEKASGHFGFASTALRYIGDEASATPMVQFDYLMSFLTGDPTEIKDSPLEALDALYAGILHDIPDNILHLAKQILRYRAFISQIRLSEISVQVFCNLFSMDQATFYSALRKLHSVIDVPAPGVALQTVLRFYHASFDDYLQDPHRSGGFINENDAWLDFAKVCLSWYKTDLALFHTDGGFQWDARHQHGVLPGLKWVSADNQVQVSFNVAREATNRCWRACRNVSEWDDVLLSQLHNFDFRYIRQDDHSWLQAVSKSWEVDPLSDFIRTEPQNEIDLRLLGYMKVMVEFGKPVKPAVFPLEYGLKYGNYFILGHGSTTVVCWTTGLLKQGFVILNHSEAPSKERIAAYRALFEDPDDSSTDEDSDCEIM